MAHSPDPVALLASELVTNAYRHTKGPASLRLTALGDGRLRVGVRDSSPHVPAPFGEPPGARVPLAPVNAEGGCGLLLLRECASTWGGWSLGEGPPGGGGTGKLLRFEV